jgi:photosystem II stability/assembly factor-like uncharacterized protein
MMKSPSNSAVIYAGTRSGIWKSVDLGETWVKTSFPDTEVLSIQVFPDNQNILYAGTSHSYENAGIYKSVDGGLTWSIKGIAGQDINAIAVDPGNTNTILAGTGSWESDWPEEIIGIFKSTNGGESWKLTASFGGAGQPRMKKITAIVVDPDDSSYIYAGGHNYGSPVFAAFLESKDGGETWSDKSFKGLWHYIGGLAITPKGYHPKTLFITLGDDPSPDQFKYFCTSTDRGETWNSWSATFNRAITVNPSNSDFVYVGSGIPGAPFWMFNHRTGTWIQFISDGFPDQPLTRIVMDAEEGGWFCAGFISGGIYRIHSSSIWYQTRMNATNILDVAVHPGSSTTVVAAIEGNYHLSRSTDGGKSWGEIINSPTNRSAVTYDPGNPQHLYAGFGWEYRTGASYHLDMSTDGGLSWTNSGLLFYSPGSISVRVTDIWIHPDNSQKIVVSVGGVDGGIYITGNGGATWAYLDYEFWASTVAADPNDFERLFHGTFHYGYVMLSDNGGNRWMDISPEGNLFWEVREIAVDEKSKVYAATDVGLWVCEGGAWAKTIGLPTDDVTAIVIDRSAEPEILYVGSGDSGVFTSNDGGDSWKVFNEGLDVLHVTRLAVSQTEPKMLYAGTAFGGLWQYDFTADKCAEDFDQDGDVDGSDLVKYIADPAGISLEDFALKFGSPTCP